MKKTKILSMILTGLFVCVAVPSLASKTVKADDYDDCYDDCGDCDDCGDYGGGYVDYTRVNAESFVTRLYQVTLGRTPDANGLNGWADALVNRKNTGVATAYGFIFSGEFQNKGYTNEQYVDRMYEAFFGRAADANGKAAWVAQLNNGMSREELFAGFANSTEFYNLCKSYGIVAGTYVQGKDVDQLSKTNLFVDRLYSVILGRECDMGGMQGWTNVLVSGESTGADVAYGFVFSSEYKNKNKSDSQYVDDLYRAFMGRNADAAGRAAWIRAIDRGTSDLEVFNGFACSNEFTQICGNYGINRGDAVSAEATSARNNTVVNAPSNGSQILVWSWNDEFPMLIDTYTDYEVQAQIYDSNEYQSNLRKILASGENAPDIFVMDSDYARTILNSGNMLPISELGIADSELADMYQYTKDMMTLNGTLYGVAWQGCPTVVFYNMNVSQRYLGVREPNQVAPYFASWDAFLNTARTVNRASNGQAKAISGIDDIFRTYAYGGSSSPWGSADGHSVATDYLLNLADLDKALYGEHLTFETGQWTDVWASSMTNNRVLSYWGPMWLAKFSMGLGSDSDGDGVMDNPTSGAWRVVKAPGNTFWGGTWIGASKYCNNKAEVADIIRAIAINPTNLRDMANGGEFVNNKSVMASMANNPAYNMSWLGGQNPASVLHETALGIKVVDTGSTSYPTSDAFFTCLNDYISGDIGSRAAFRDAFNAKCAELGV